jgi:hypothetical protein
VCFVVNIAFPLSVLPSHRGHPEVHMLRLQQLGGYDARTNNVATRPIIHAATDAMRRYGKWPRHVLFRRCYVLRNSVNNSQD